MLFISDTLRNHVENIKERSIALKREADLRILPYWKRLLGLLIHLIKCKVCFLAVRVEAVFSSRLMTLITDNWNIIDISTQWFSVHL